LHELSRIPAAKTTAIMITALLMALLFYVKYVIATNIEYISKQKNTAIKGKT
jgi:hypothetical protein